MKSLQSIICILFFPVISEACLGGQKESNGKQMQSLGQYWFVMYSKGPSWWQDSTAKIKLDQDHIIYNISLKVIPEDSKVDWYAEKLTGHHKGAVNISSGTVLVAGNKLLSGSFVLDMRTITVTDLSGKDKQTLEGNFRGDYFFDAKHYPTASFEILSLSNADKSADIEGKLTMHGITKNIRFTADINKCTQDEFSADAKILINRQDWQIATSNMLYNTLIKPDLWLHVVIKATK
jgi:polyisoprenoid-binding protein YceI